MIYTFYNPYNFYNFYKLTAKGSVGAMGGKFSHEYHLISEVGEDDLLFCNSCGSAINSELNADDNNFATKCLNCGANDIIHKNGIEVGHAFLLGTKYSKAFDANFLAENESKKYAFFYKI